MREILFRGQTRRKGEKVHAGTGKPVDGNWVYGGITQGTGDFSVIYSYSPVEKHVVYTDTVGQFTGLTDKNGKKIFEGDIVTGRFLHSLPINSVVTFRNGSFGLLWDRAGEETFDAFTSLCNIEYEAIGNIHDNPELLGGRR